MKNEVASPSQPDKKEYGKFDKYEVDNAVDTLLRAEEIKGNADLMTHVEKCLAKKYRAIQSVRDLKDAAKELDEEDDEE